MAGGGSNNMLDMGLMIAAGIAAPELAPALMEGGALGIGGLTSGTAATALTGAGLSGLTAAATGQNVGQAALMGGLGGAAAGYFGGVNPAEQGSMLASGQTAPGANLSTVPSNIQPVYPQAPTPPESLIGPGPFTPSAPSQDVLNQMASEANASENAANAKSFGATNKAAMIGGGAAGINALINTPPTGAYIPPGATYMGGNLQKFKYDPTTYQPDVVVPPNPKYKAQYAEGGITSLAMGGMPGQMYPQSQQEHTIFANPTQLPTNAMAVRNFEPATNPMTGDTTQAMAKGGVASNSFSDLMKSRDSMDKYMSDYNSDPSGVYQKAKNGDYNAILVLNKLNQTPNENYASGGITQLNVGGKLLKGHGDGMSDSIHANIDGRQEARLADGEFVIPADVVSHLGNGSTDAGAKHLYSMMDKVRKARTGNPKQGKEINPMKYLSA